MTTTTSIRFSLVASAIQPNGAWAKSLKCPQTEELAVAALEASRMLDLPTPTGLFTGYSVTLTRVVSVFGSSEVKRERIGEIQMGLSR